MTGNTSSHFLESIGVKTQNIALYEVAFTHKSFANENDIENNERLEFLGDAVLELQVTEFLYTTFPHLPEGIMTALRSTAVRKESLANLAKKIKLGVVIKLSKGERNGFKKDYILANTVEALLGAIYLDKGVEDVQIFLQKYLFPDIIQSEKNKNYIGPKSRFQEWTQAEKQITPYYKEISSSGPDHNKTFVMGVFLADEKIAEGSGNSKQEAESNAAKNGLKVFGV